MSGLLLALVLVGVAGLAVVALLLYFAGVAHGIALAQEQERFRKTLETSRKRV